MRTTSAAAVQSLLDAATRRGINVNVWLDQLGLDHATLENPEARIALPLTDRIIRKLIAATGDRDVVLETVLEAPEGQQAIFHYVTMTCQDLEEHLDLVQSFSRLWGDGVELETEQRGETVTVSFHTPGGESRGADVLRFVAQAWMAAVCVRARLATGGAFQPDAVTFTHPAPRETGRAERVFGVRPHYDAPTNAIVFPASMLALPFPQGDDENLPALLRSRAQGLLEGLPGTEELGLFVRDRVRAALREGPVTLEDIASGMGMGPRTLQRRLSAEGASFRELLDGCQRELAIDYMGNKELAVAEVAGRLGFETQSAFTKKFKRWTGKTPREYRRELASASSQ